MYTYSYTCEEKKCMHSGEMGIMKDKAKEKNKKSSEKKKSDKKKKNELKEQKAGKKKKEKKNLKSVLFTEERPEREEAVRPEKETVLIQEERKPKKTAESNAEEGGKDWALIYRALGDESRLQILELLREREMCAADLLKLVPIVQSTLSHHMKILCESGLVLCRRQARWSYYSVNRQLFQETAERLKEWSE